MLIFRVDTCCHKEKPGTLSVRIYDITGYNFTEFLNFVLKKLELTDNRGKSCDS